MEKKLGQDSAFPTDHRDGDSWGHKLNSGISKRLYIAIKAMQVIPPPTKYVGHEETTIAKKEWAQRCFMMADELLKQENL